VHEQRGPEHAAQRVGDEVERADRPGRLYDIHRVLGDDHPDTRISAHNLAIDLDALGEEEQAQEQRTWVAARLRRLTDSYRDPVVTTQDRTCRGASTRGADTGTPQKESPTRRCALV
jgi:hypothetical protein